MKTSVIITVYNRPEMLIACLRALALQTRPIDEAIVSDDGSLPEAQRQMQAAFPELPFPISYVSQDDKGYRLAATRNNALRLARGEYIISLDCDILLLPDAVAIHLQRARRGLFLAANRALLDTADTRSILTNGFSARLLDFFWLRSERGHLRRIQRQFNRNLGLRKLGLARPHKPKILGCHFSLFRADIERVNGFDEQYTGWGYEDDDFARRLHLAGVRGRSLIMEARAMHLWHPPSGTAAHSSNKAYFNRPKISAYCQHGLHKKHLPEPLS